MSTISTSTKPPHHPKSNPTQHNYKKPSTFQQQQQQHSDITKEEFERISEALKKEEFRKLFLDYIEEIQDPENRKRYEEEITQIERERGVDVTFIHPEPGFVIKTSQDGNQKCFINCAKNEHIAKPMHQISLDHKTGKRGINWSIPLAQAPPRDDLDNNNKRCRVYDVVFHPDALYLAERNKSFQKCLVDTALDAVEREFKVSLDRVNLKFPKLQFKGIARPTVIRKLAKEPPSADCNEPHPLESIYPPKPTASSCMPKVLPMKTINCSSKSTKNTSSSEYCTPKYTIKHRHDVDLSEYTNELDAKLNHTKPRELVVDIELPLLNSSNECQLDVTDKTVFLLSERAGAKYRLNIDLPYPVNDKSGSAKFDTDTRRLTITLPVIQPSIEKQREMHETLLHLSREDSGVESDVRDEFLSNKSESPVEEMTATSFESELKKASESENNSTKLEEEAVITETTLEEPFLKSNIEYQLPSKFDCHILNNTMCWVLHVRNVQQESLEMKHEHNWLHLKFTSIGSGYYPTHYAFYVKLFEDDNETDNKIVAADVEAWENNVILNINLNNNAEGIYSYLAGIDSEHQQEYILDEQFGVPHKSRQRQKEEQKPKSFDYSIERIDGENFVEIKVKPKSNKESTCKTNNTTEDDEELHLQYDSNSDVIQTTTTSNQKKINKKQKRKNKKRRSLSESDCDNIKQYHHQQELQETVITPIPVPEDNKTENGEDDGDADDDEDSSPDRTEKSLKHLLPTSLSVNVPTTKNTKSKTGTVQQRKQRSFSESRDSVISLSAGSCSYKGILKHYSRYDPRPSISDSCDSFDEISSSAYSTSVDGMSSALNSLRFSQSFSDIPEENVVGLSESCKKTVRFSEVIKKQVFRLDSSILGQRKKNQKRRDRKQRKLQRRLSEGDSADYEDNKPMAPITTSSDDAAQCLKTNNHNQQNLPDNCKNNGNGNTKMKALDKKTNKIRARLESESSSDIDNNKNSMMFEMDM